MRQSEEQRLTVIMYHYVRDLCNSRYPDIKGLDVKLFEQQVEYLQRHYHPVTMEQVISALEEGTSLPSKSVLLTFDDGYADHFTNVFPVLYNRGVQGSFFAPVKAVTQHTVLDVNKIHFILASMHSVDELLGKVKAALARYRTEYNLESYDYYYTKLAGEDRYDTPQVLFIKRLLQVELPLDARMKIVDELFVDAVGMSEGAFSRELYMSLEQMRTMVRCGMHVGSHGFDHFWLGSLSAQQQQQEICRSVDFIHSVAGTLAGWTICYPYGNYNESTLSLLEQYGCHAGFTTEVKVADVQYANRYTLSRLDTNDIPKHADAPVNDWWTKG